MEKVMFKELLTKYVLVNKKCVKIKFINWAKTVF